jgi:hypothetical protein
MQTLSGKSIDKFYKSCRVFHYESEKLSLHFSDFSMIFYAFSKFQHFGNTIEDSVFTGVPGIFLFFTDMPLDCRLAPKKIKSFAIWPLAKGRRRARRNPAVPAALPTG